MRCESLVILIGASAVLAVTSQGFEPAAVSNLLVSFGNVVANGGNVLAREVTQATPRIGTQSRVQGTSFAVLMIDLDIPTDTPPQTGTLLHWLQTGLTQSSTSTAINTTTGSTTAFLFQTPQGQAAFAPYIGPSPPARIPLSHRYTEILVNTSAATDENLAVLQNAASTRRGFDTLAVLTEAGLADKVLAGNFFNVTNPGPVSSNSSTGTGNGSGGTANNTTGNGSGTTPTQTPLIPTAGAAQTASGMLLAIAMVAAVFVTL